MAKLCAEFWSLLQYRLPPKVDLKKLQEAQCSRPTGCPMTPGQSFNNITFDKVVANEYCPPLTLRDLTFFCETVAFTAENLHFHFAFLHYMRKWDALSEQEKALSPPQFLSHKPSRPMLLKIKRSDTAEPASGVPCPGESLGKKTEREQTAKSDKPGDGSHAILASESRPFSWQRTASMDSQRTAVEEVARATSLDLNRQVTVSCLVHRSNDAMKSCIKADTGIDWAPKPRLPLRGDIDKIITMFLLSSSPHQLNLPYATSRSALAALNQTSHPVALKPVSDHIHGLLDEGVMPNFVRYAASNANDPRKWASILGSVVTLLVALLLTILNVVEGKARLLRLIAFPSLWCGWAALLAAARGSCLILAIRHRVQERPYDLQGEQAIELEQVLSSHHPIQDCRSHNTAEEWTTQWKRKAMFWKLIDRGHVTTGPYRRMQSALVVQCLVHGFLLSLLCIGVMMAIPVRSLG